jgi:hypothetical protein
MINKYIIYIKKNYWMSRKKVGATEGFAYGGASPSVYSAGSGSIQVRRPLFSRVATHKPLGFNLPDVSIFSDI